MSTHRLYFDDPCLVRFAAHLVARDGARVALDRSAFYPEGGGQPADRGMLSGVPVTDVQVDEAGVVWHTLAGPLDTDEVIGEVDWARRLDLMQQHHGQHLLSAAFEELFQLPTISFHLGPDSSTIDLATPAVTAGQAEAVEARTNQVIWEDRPVYARFVSREELAGIPLRKPPVVDGPIRVVSVPDFDHSACGGTHPRATGTVGLLQIRRLERRGAATRVEFVCGGRALRDLRQKHGVLSRLAAATSVGVNELEEKVARLAAEHGALRKKLGETRRTLRGWIAQDMIDNGAGPIVDGVTLIADHSPQGEEEETRFLAMELASRGAVALLACTGEGSGYLVFAAPVGRFDAARLLRATLAQFPGKGGGRKALAEGVIEDASQATEAVRWARRQAEEQARNGWPDPG